MAVLRSEITQAHESTIMRESVLEEVACPHTTADLLSVVFQTRLELAENNILELWQDKIHFFPGFFCGHNLFVKGEAAFCEVV